MKHILFFIILFGLLGFTVAAQTTNQQSAIELDWESLKDSLNDGSEWFRDAKIGIYYHWDVYSIPW